MPLFEIRFVETPDSVFIRLIGEFDLASRELFEGTLFPVESAKGHVAVDLSELEFMDCSGVGLLVELRNQLALAGIRLQLHGARGTVRTILDLTETLLLDRTAERNVSVRTETIRCLEQTVTLRELQDHA